jgi:predicted ArsR family transcriptional regulator
MPYDDAERNEVSVHEARVYLALLAGDRWLTANDVAEQASVAPRTARAHCLKLVRLGLVDQVETFPAHRYRWSEKGSKRNRGYLQRLEQAVSVFGIG